MKHRKRGRPTGRVKPGIIVEGLTKRGKVSTYPVSETFPTIQGEGFYTGTPAYFIRLQGCPVGCPWCDTKYTWPLTENTHPRMSAAELAQDVTDSGLDHVVITGGEPLVHDLADLIDALLEDGRTVQIETSGTYKLPPRRPGLHVTVSPKFDMPGGLPVLADALEYADEIKMPVGKMTDVDKLLEHVSPSRRVYLQPLSQSKRATEVCVQAAQRHNVNVSVQTHKFIGVE